MGTLLMKRLGAATLGAIATMTAGVLPAGALGISVGGSSLVHVNDCRSVALARQAGYDFEFSSNTTGPRAVHAAVASDGSLTLCYSLDATTASAVQLSTWTDVTVDLLVANILGEADAGRVCSAIRLQVAPGVRGTVSATSNAQVAVDGQPPVAWNHTFAKDVTVDSVGEDIVLKGCVATDGSASVS